MTRPVKVSIAALAMAFVVIFAGCQASPGPQGEEPSFPDATPTAPADAEVPTHLVLAREAYHLMEEAGDRAWSGWGEAVPPVVVMMGDRHRVLGTPPADGEWRQVGPDEWEGPPIDGVGPGVQMTDGRPFAATLPVDDLQQLIDQAVGDGRITLDPPRYVRFVVHEAFHAFQIETLNGELPDFGLEGDERELLPELTESDIAAGLAAEARALAAALRAEAEADALATAREFLVLRDDRRATMSSDAIALERSLEWTEGLARYADMAIVEAATEEYRPTPEFATLSGYPSADEVVAELLGWLDEVTAVPGTVRDRYYEVGAGEARLLDRLMPGWHSRALPDGQALESLLEEAVEGAEAGIAPTLRALEARTVAVAGAQLSVAVADRPEFWSSGLAGVHTVEPLDGVLFVFPDPVDAAFTNRGMAFALDVFFFDSDGRLVDTVAMPACPEGPCDAFEVRAAFQYTLEVPAGSVPALSAGDLLDLDKEG